VLALRCSFFSFTFHIKLLLKPLVRPSQAARKGYEQLLEEAREKICADTKWSDFEKMMEVEPRFKAMAETSADRKERRALFEALVAPLRQAREKGMFLLVALCSFSWSLKPTYFLCCTNRNAGEARGGEKRIHGSADRDKRDKSLNSLVKGYVQLPSACRSSYYTHLNLGYTNRLRCYWKMIHATGQLNPRMNERSSLMNTSNLSLTSFVGGSVSLGSLSPLLHRSHPLVTQWHQCGGEA